MVLKVVLPLPLKGFDTTEAAVAWHMLKEAGIQVHFATETGEAAECDLLLLKGPLFGLLGADKEAKAHYKAMCLDAAFQAPLKWNELLMMDYDGVWLSGGHEKNGMRPYLESSALQDQLRIYFPFTKGDHHNQNKVLAAVCHGPLLLARTMRKDGKTSILKGRRTTVLPKYMERSAYYLTAAFLGDYYRTYPAYAEDEVREALQDQRHLFERGPLNLFASKAACHAHVVQDERYLSARWPGDVRKLAGRFIELLNEQQQQQEKTRDREVPPPPTE